MFIIKEVGTAAECADRKGVSAASAYSISRQKSADWQLTDKRHSNPRQSSSPPVKGKIKVSFMGTTNLDSLTSKGSVNYMALSLLLDSFFILFFTNVGAASLCLELKGDRLYSRLGEKNDYSQH